jgi:hypothetical protein
LAGRCDDGSKESAEGKESEKSEEHRIDENNTDALQMHCSTMQTRRCETYADEYDNYKMNNYE